MYSMSIYRYHTKYHVKIYVQSVLVLAADLPSEWAQMKHDDYYKLVTLALQDEEYRFAVSEFRRTVRDKTITQVGLIC